MTPAELKDWATVIIGIVLSAGTAVITIYARLGAVRSKQQLLESRAANVALGHARATIDRMWAEILSLQGKRPAGVHAADGDELLQLRALEPDEPADSLEAVTGDGRRVTLREPAAEAPAAVPMPAPEIASQPAPQPRAEPATLDTRALWTSLGAQ